MEIERVASERRRSAWNQRCIVVSAMAMLALCQCTAIEAQITPGQQQPSVTPTQLRPIQESRSEPGSQRETEAELQVGTAFTRKGLFREAIPHLLAARSEASHEYAANFNLALCYVGTSQFRPAIAFLNGLRRSGHDGVDVENLLAQAYIGNAQPQEALASLEKAATLAPQNEKLYVFVADACMDHREYGLGLKVVDIGLRNLPQSARLHYEQAMFLTELDQFDQAKPQFELAGKLAAGSEIGYLATAQQELFAGEVVDAIRSAREGVKKGYENPALLTILGEALIRSGVSPGQAEFVEAQSALEQSVTQRPNDPTSQIALGGLYLTAGRLEDAISHLKTALQLEPGKPSIYAKIAKAYQRHGDAQLEQDALAALEKLNREQADRISSAPGDRKLGYAGRRASEEDTVPHP
jgi:predicted Zn-dependent protease